MTETHLTESIDAIVTRVSAADTTVKVWDGPILTGDYGDAIYIGFDGRYEDSEEAASSTQQKWASGIGQNARDEEHQITCSVVKLTGNADTSWKDTREAAYAMLGIVGQVLRDDPSLGLTPPSVAELWPGDYFQEPGPQGMQARIVFSIHHKTRV